MLTQERRSQILELIELEGSGSVTALSSRFAVSTMTIWRDLKALKHEGVVRQVRGGAVRIESEAVLEAPFQVRRRSHNRQKAQIARYAAAHLVEPGDILILQGSTTVAAMLPHLTQSGLTLLTNGLEVFFQAKPTAPNLSFVCSGGVYRDVSRTFVGPQAERFFGERNANRLFFSVTALTADEGPTDPGPLEIGVKQAMCVSAEQVILLLDSSKFGRRSLSQVVPLDRLDMMVTDSDAPAETLDELRARGLEVRVAGAGAGEGEKSLEPQHDQAAR